MPDLPGPETPLPESDAPPTGTVPDGTLPDGTLPPAEPMTNAPIPLAEDEPGVGLTRSGDEPDGGTDDAAGGRAL